MITLSLSWVMLFYLALFIVTVAGVWLIYVLGRHHHERSFLRFRVLCRICATEFEDRSNEVLPRCPVCGSLNERSEIERL
jgi:rRNA maturation endonuclease Nob1